MKEANSPLLNVVVGLAGLKHPSQYLVQLYILYTNTCLITTALSNTYLSTLPLNLLVSMAWHTNDILVDIESGEHMGMALSIAKFFLVVIASQSKNKRR